MALVLTPAYPVLMPEHKLLELQTLPLLSIGDELVFWQKHQPGGSDPEQQRCKMSSGEPMAKAFLYGSDPSKHLWSERDWKTVFINWAHLAWSLLSCGGKHGGRGPPHCHLGAPWLIEVELMSFWSVTCFSSFHELLLSCRCFWIPAYLIKTNYIFIAYFYHFQFPVLITFSCQSCESLVITMK